jgi:hypothetical protein
MKTTSTYRFYRHDCICSVTNFGTWYVAFKFVPIEPIQCEIHLGNFHGVQSSVGLFSLLKTTSTSPFLILPLILVLTLKLFLLGSLGVSLSLVLQIKNFKKNKIQIKKPLNFDSKTMFVFITQSSRLDIA